MRVITYDLVGAGQSDLAAYDRAKYSTLLGYADDLNAIIDDFGQGPVIIAGHSVSAMIGVLAELRQPGRIAGLVLIGGPLVTSTRTVTTAASARRMCWGCCR